MTYLPSLIKKIDNFYHLINLGAVTPDYSYDPTKPQEEEIDERGDKLYQDIMSNLDDFENQSIADEVWTLAELYKGAILSGAGFAECLKRAEAAKSSVENFANGAVDARDLANAKKYISEMQVNLTKAVKSAPPVAKNDQEVAARNKAIINNIKDQQTKELMSESIKEKSLTGEEFVYEKGKPGEESSHLIGNPTGVDKRKEQYEQEIEHLKNAQNDPNYHFSEAERKNVPLLIAINRRLLSQMQAFVRAEATLSAAPEDPEYKAAFEKEKAQLDSLRKERYKIRIELSKHFQMKRYDQFVEQSNKAGDPKEKQWLDLNARLAQLTLSDKYNKRPLVAALSQLIAETGKIIKPAMGQETFVPIEINKTRFDELVDQIKEANSKLLDPKVYDEIRAARKAKEHGLIGEIQRRQKGKRGGGSRRSKLSREDIGAATFHGLVDKLSEKINTATHVSKLNVTQFKNSAGKKVHNELKDFVDDLAESLRNVVKFNRPEDHQAKFAAIRVLKEKMKEAVEREPAIKALEINARLLPFFKAYEAKLYMIDRWKGNKPWNLDNNQKRFVIDLLNDFDRLMRITEEYWGGRSQLDANFGSAMDYISKVLGVLEYETGVYAYRAGDLPEEEVLIEEPVIEEKPVGVRVEPPRVRVPGIRVPAPQPKIEEELEEAPEEESELKRMWRSLQSSKRKEIFENLIKMGRNTNV